MKYTLLHQKTYPNIKIANKHFDQNLVHRFSRFFGLKDF